MEKNSQGGVLDGIKKEPFVLGSIISARMKIWLPKTINTAKVNGLHTSGARFVSCTLVNALDLITRGDALAG